MQFYEKICFSFILQHSDGYGWMELDFGDPTDPKYGHHQHYPGGPPKEPLFDHKLASLFKSRNKSLHALEFHVEQSAYREWMRMVVSWEDLEWFPTIFLVKSNAQSADTTYED